MTRRIGTHIFLNLPYRSLEGHHVAHPPEGHSLDAEIDRAELRERYKSYLGGHYLSLHITVVSVVLAAAGLAAASLIARPMGPHYEHLLLWLLWLGSLAAAAVAYGGPMVGAFALPAAIPSIADLMLPLLVGVSEFLLFTILIDQVSPARQDLDRTANSWLIVMAVFSFVACLSVLRARYLYSTGVHENIYSDEVATMVDRYLGHLNRDACAAAAVTALAATGAGLSMSGLLGLYVYIFPAFITAMLFVGLRGHNVTAEMWRELMPSKLATYHKDPPIKHQK